MRRGGCAGRSPSGLMQSRTANGHEWTRMHANLGAGALGLAPRALHRPMLRRGQCRIEVFVCVSLRRFAVAWNILTSALSPNFRHVGVRKVIPAAGDVLTVGPTAGRALLRDKNRPPVDSTGRPIVQLSPVFGIRHRLDGTCHYNQSFGFRLAGPAFGMVSLRDETHLLRLRQKIL